MRYTRRVHADKHLAVTRYWLWNIGFSQRTPTHQSHRLHSFLPMNLQINSAKLITALHRNRFALVSFGYFLVRLLTKKTSSTQRCRITKSPNSPPPPNAVSMKASPTCLPPQRRHWESRQPPSSMKQRRNCTTTTPTRIRSTPGR